jgi:hypothetical protein
MTEKTLVVDLTQERLKLSICQVCFAIMLRQHGDAHWQWHLKTDLMPYPEDQVKEQPDQPDQEDQR